MRILYVMRSIAHFHYHKSVIKHLCSNGHNVLALFDSGWSEGYDNISVEIFRSETKGFNFDWSIRRSDLWRLPLFSIRELTNYSRYLRFDQSPYYLERWAGYFNRVIQVVLRHPAVKRVLKTDLIQSCLHVFERLVPSDRVITDWLKKNQPDVVVASPINMRLSEEIEYIKAAKALKIPTIVPVLSWDNLTTKGVFHIFPNLTLVWNRKQFEEAANYLSIPRDKIIITGAPFFDQWFEKMQPSVDYMSFCKQVGIDSSKPFIAYLGSSRNIAKDETWLVNELARCLRNSSNIQTRGMSILVRPHPANAKIYSRLSGPNVAVWPKEGTLPNTVGKFQDFYNTLYYSVCAVGLNTSGMIDAMIADSPCITIMPDRYRLTQSQALHFQHLLDADVLEIANNSSECVDLILAILRGEDSKKENRRLFVKEFIRPRGIQKSPGWIMGKSIEMVGLGQSIDQINSVFDLEEGQKL